MFDIKNIWCRFLVNCLISFTFTNCIMEHSFIGIYAEFYGLSHKKHMEMLYPTIPTLILLSVSISREGGGQSL